MRLSVDLENGRAVRPPFVDIIEPTNVSLSTNAFKGGGDDILESSVFVCSRSSHHHVCGRRLASVRREDCNVQDIPREEEPPCYMVRELCEARGRLVVQRQKHWWC